MPTKDTRKPVAASKSTPPGVGMGEGLLNVLRGSWDSVVGASETATSVATGLASSIPAGLSGLGKLATSGSLEKAASEVQRVQGLGTYTPKTRVGQGMMKLLGEGLEKIPTAGPTAFEKTGSPAAGTAGEFLDPTVLIPGLKALGVSGAAALAAMKAIEKTAAVKGVDISSKVPRIARGQEGLIKGQRIYRGTEQTQVDPKVLSRRLDSPGVEGGMHVSVSKDTAEGMTFNFNDPSSPQGALISMRANVSKPFWVEDTGGTWKPDLFVDAILDSTKQKLPREAQERLAKLSSEYTKEIKIGPEGLPTVSLRELDNIHNKYSKEIQGVLKKEGYDHVSYINKREGKPVESAIIFDKEDVKVNNVEDNKTRSIVKQADEKLKTNFVQYKMLQGDDSFAASDYKISEYANIIDTLSEKQKAIKEALKTETNPKKIENLTKTKQLLDRNLNKTFEKLFKRDQELFDDPSKYDDGIDMYEEFDMSEPEILKDIQWGKDHSQPYPRILKMQQEMDRAATHPDYLKPEDDIPF